MTAQSDSSKEALETSSRRNIPEQIKQWKVRKKRLSFDYRDASGIVPTQCLLEPGLSGGNRALRQARPST